MVIIPVLVSVGHMARIYYTVAMSTEMMIPYRIGKVQHLCSLCAHQLHVFYCGRILAMVYMAYMYLIHGPPKNLKLVGWK